MSTTAQTNLRRAVTAEQRAREAITKTDRAVHAYERAALRRKLWLWLAVLASIAVGVTILLVPWLAVLYALLLVAHWDGIGKARRRRPAHRARQARRNFGHPDAGSFAERKRVIRNRAAAHELHEDTLIALFLAEVAAGVHDSDGAVLDWFVLDTVKGRTG